MRVSYIPRPEPRPTRNSISRRLSHRELPAQSDELLVRIPPAAERNWTLAPWKSRFMRSEIGATDINKAEFFSSV